MRSNPDLEKNEELDPVPPTDFERQAALEDRDWGERPDEVPGPVMKDESDTEWRPKPSVTALSCAA